jgi:hypothetical protein
MDEIDTARAQLRHKEQVISCLRDMWCLPAGEIWVQK